MADALNSLPNQTKHVGVPNQTYDAHLFTLQPKWLQSLYEHLLEGVMPKIFTTSQRWYLIQRTKPFVLQEGVLYIFRQDNKFRQVLQPEHVSIILQKLHGGVARGHFSFDINVQKILDAGYWRPTMNGNVHEYC
jgi:hypothetical protein